MAWETQSASSSGAARADAASGLSMRLGAFVGRWDGARIWALPAGVVLGLGLLGLFGGDYEVDTALYAGVAAHMVREGTWWTPMAGDYPYFNKPPLVLWIHAVFIAVLGDALWAIRLPQLIAAMAAVVLTCYTALLLSGRRVAMLSGLILATTVPFFAYLDRFVMDYWVVAFVMGGVALVVRGVVSASTRWVVLAGVPIGLSMLCKPVFGLLAIPVLGVWIAIDPARRRIGLRASLLGLGAAAGVAVVVAAPWHASMVWQHGDVFLDQYLGREIAERIGDGAFKRDPLWKYAEFVVVRYQPWQIPMWLMLGWIVWRVVRPKHGSRGAVGHVWGGGVALCVVWGFCWLVLLSMFGDKRVRYMMHVWPVLGWLSAVWLVRFGPGMFRKRGARSIDWVIGIFVVVAGMLGLFGLTGGDPPKDDWVELQRAAAELSDREGVELWEGLLHPPRSGEVYLTTGVWPKTMYPGNGLRYRSAPGGAAVLWQRDRLGELEAPDIIGASANIVLLRWRPRDEDATRRRFGRGSGG